MDKEQVTKKLPRPDLHVKPSQWSATQRGGLASRFAIIGTITGIIGGLSLVFIYPYFNIDRFREYLIWKSNKIFIKLSIIISAYLFDVGKIQKVNRAGINPEDVQPIGKNIILSIHTLFFLLGLPVWRDPFDRKKTG